MKKKSLGRILIVLGVLFLPALFWLIIQTGKNQFRHLPIIGPFDVTENGDTIYHVIPPFRFINQEGTEISDQDLDGKIYVANFFFARCPEICPKMNDQLKRVQKAFREEDAVRILSHTVNPENDSIEVLNAYAAEKQADKNRWWFLTGNKDSIYTLARIGYLVIAAQGKTDIDFFHSQDLILVDKEKRIRGIYDGLEQAEVDTLIDEIKVLLLEYKN